MFHGVPSRYENVHDEPPFDKHSSFYLFGTTGTGKTHYACAMINISKAKHGISRVGLVSVPELVMNYKNASFEEKGVMIKRYSAGMFIFDDIGAEYQSEFSQEFIHMIIEKRWSRKLWTGFTTNFSIGELPYSDRIKSRIAGIVRDNVHELSGKDKRLKQTEDDESED